MAALGVMAAGCTLDRSGRLDPARGRDDAGSRDAAADRAAPSDARADRGGGDDAGDDSGRGEDAGRDAARDAGGDAGTDAGCTIAPGGLETAVAAPAGAVALDGDLSEWSRARFISMQPPEDWVALEDDAPTPSDISGRFAAMWDADALYFAVAVTDDGHHNDSSGELIWMGDSVQIGLDVARDGGTGGYDAEDDWEYGWALTGSGQQSWRWHAPDGAPAAANTFVATRAESRTTTTYEVRMPASDLGLTTLEAGRRIGAGLIVNENDGDGRTGWIEWASGVGFAPKTPEELFELVLRACE